jgi:hypothetical protein
MGDQNSTYGLHSLPGGVRLVTWTIPAVTWTIPAVTWTIPAVTWTILAGINWWSGQWAVAPTPGGCQVGYVDGGPSRLSSTGVLAAK